MKLILLILALLFCITQYSSPAAALVLGLIFVLVNKNSASNFSNISKNFLAWSIVGLGTTVNINSIYEVSISNFGLTVFSLLTTILTGWLIGSFLGISTNLKALISSGTAICGATAIAAIGETINAKKEETSLALGVILILNGVALFLFPYLGHLLNLSSIDFGVWAGLAIHDTSSVVGAAMQYSLDSVETATTVKLARAVWIAPLAILFSYLIPGSDGKVSFKLPWFIGGFVISAALFSFVPGLSQYSSSIGLIARKGFVIGIFLLGASIDIKNLKSLGIKPFLFGIILWLISSVVSLVGVYQN